MTATVTRIDEVRAVLTDNGGVFTRWPCRVCGGTTEKVNVLCEVPPGRPHAGLRVCEFCLESGDLAARLDERVAALRERIAELMALRGRLVAPTYVEWQHAEALADAIFASGHRVEEALKWPLEKQLEWIEKARRRDAEFVAVERGKNDGHYFGACPECGTCDGYRNIGRNHWFFCAEHKTKWCAGSNLLSSWQQETEAHWEDSARFLADFKEVEPIYPGIKSSVVCDDDDIPF